MSLPDYLDINSIGSDSHLQFMNWTVDNNGAWDYAADTRGYTYAAVAEYDDKDLVRPLRARADADRRQRHRPRLESAPCQRPELGVRAAQAAPRQPASAQIARASSASSSYVNHAHMGLYRDANKAYLAGEAPTRTSRTSRRTAR